MVSASIGVAVGSCTKDPRAAGDFIPAILLPQTLFSGFFVPLLSIPYYARWLSLLMPLTYLFRLGIYHEFLSCQDYSTEKDKHFADCANLIWHLVEKDLVDEFRGNSTFKLAQAGFYKGSKDVKEYIDFFNQAPEHPSSVVVKFCRVSKTTQCLPFSVFEKLGCTPFYALN
jgi:hypothetical protein